MKITKNVFLLVMAMNEKSNELNRKEEPCVVEYEVIQLHYQPEKTCSTLTFIGLKDIK